MCYHLKWVLTISKMKWWVLAGVGLLKRNQQKKKKIFTKIMYINKTSKNICWNYSMGQCQDLENLKHRPDKRYHFEGKLHWGELWRLPLKTWPWNTSTKRQWHKKRAIIKGLFKVLRDNIIFYKIVIFIQIQFH